MVAAFDVNQRCTLLVCISAVDFNDDGRVVADLITRDHVSFQYGTDAVNAGKALLVERPMVACETLSCIARHALRDGHLILGEEVQQHARADGQGAVRRGKLRNVE